jgi:hypothetical protein
MLYALPQRQATFRTILPIRVYLRSSAANIGF